MRAVNGGGGDTAPDAQKAGRVPVQNASNASNAVAHSRGYAGFFRVGLAIQRIVIQKR